MERGVQDAQKRAAFERQRLESREERLRQVQKVVDEKAAKVRWKEHGGQILIRQGR